MSPATPPDGRQTGRDPEPAEIACFEAGIKFGSLYHQFAGTPVSPSSAESLASAMEEAIENQPHCVDVTVDVDTGAIERELTDTSASYTEVTGRFLEVEIVVETDEYAVTSRMQMDGDYPLMSVVSVDESVS
ncbi:dihydroneopterin aldolase family protein [Halovivax gelatinilyticus]|uniref:dihydroneopterin aldolase family protein n=1 Tax=Halovivax gelatinilyticus TaxID=2961597 RepID=UPI0020CA7EFC|nr:dihydroneopterin aldolase family protein [Halovivax gelatinilyticus]